MGMSRLPLDKDSAALAVGRLPCCGVLVTSYRHSIHCSRVRHCGSERRRDMAEALRLNPSLWFGKVRARS